MMMTAHCPIVTGGKPPAPRLPKLRVQHDLLHPPALQAQPRPPRLKPMRRRIGYVSHVWRHCRNYVHHFSNVGELT